MYFDGGGTFELIDGGGIFELIEREMILLMELDFLPLLIVLSCYKFYDLLIELGFLPLLMAGVVVLFFCY